VASENFARYPAASGLRSRSGYFGGVGCCGELHWEPIIAVLPRLSTTSPKMVRPLPMRQ
jgi:hypothetical protein